METRVVARPRGRLIDPMLRWMALLAPLCFASACGTISSYASGCPGVYSGTHYDRDLLRVYRSDVAAGAAGIRLRDAWDPWAVALDLPISAVVDTLTLPVGWALRAQPRPAGHMGCPQHDAARPWQASGAATAPSR